MRNNSISKLGEFGLIKRFASQIKTDSSVIVSSGDDCAVLRFDKKNYQLFTCDMLVEGVDFTSKVDPYLIGRKAIAVSVSDIAACAGWPRHCLVSLGFSKAATLKFLDKLFKGMLDIAREYKINIVGGDISYAKKLTIDVSMLGEVEKGNLTLRSGAKKGDIIFVSGELGGSIYGKHLRFSPRVKEARFLVENFKINSMIDISDGLIQDLSHILEQSRVGAVIYEKLIPLASQARALKEALFMGEDFELLFTAPLKEARNILTKDKFNFRPIGQITGPANGLIMVDKHNKEIVVEPGGFRHF